MTSTASAENPHGAPPPAIVRTERTKIPYSAAASAIAKLLVERSEHGLIADPQFTIDELAHDTGLTVADVKDGLYELSSFVKMSRDDGFVKESLFTEFDRFWKPWNPAEDALRLAADILNDEAFPAGCNEIAEQYGWEPRRLNPAITFLLERGMLADYRAMGTHPFVVSKVLGLVDPIRRFVKSRR